MKEGDATMSVYQGKKRLILLFCVQFFFLFGCKNNTILTPDEKISAVLSIASGKNQPGDNGERLQNPVIIKVTDIDNFPLENIQITYSIIDGGGTLDDYILLSDSSGLAPVVWTLGNGSEHIMKPSLTDQS